MRDNKDNGHDDKRFDREIEPTPAEKQAFEKLRTDLTPKASLEEKVIHSLRARGFLRPKRRVIEIRSWHIAVAVAACLALMITGYVFGRWTESRQDLRQEYLIENTDDFSVAASVQESGSAYLTALGRLTALPDSIDGRQALEGSEIALSTLVSATDQLTRLVPKNLLEERLMSAINDNSYSKTANFAGPITVEDNRVIDF